MSNLLSAIDASASALDAQRTRMEVAVSNLANAESTTGPNGQPYRRREVVLTSQPFEASFDGQANGAVGVRVAAVQEDQSDFQRISDPTNKNADADGFVAMPNVNVPEEMVDMLGAARAYQANLTAIGLIRETIQRALELAK
jgi:flagellar basal-body rod protein FlgC